MSAHKIGMVFDTLMWGMEQKDPQLLTSLNYSKA